MEIPTISAELYQRKQKHLEYELDSGLRSTGVIQISGLEQQVIDDFYGRLHEHKQALHRPDFPYLGKHFYFDYLRLSPPDNRIKEIYRNDPQLSRLVKIISKNVSDIGAMCTEAAYNLYGPFVKKPTRLFVNRYLKRQGLYSRDRKKVMVIEHKDDLDGKGKRSASFILAPSASAKGLQGQINGKWVDLAPEKGHLLAWAREEFEKYTPLKSLYHRVLFPKTDRYALLYF